MVPTFECILRAQREVYETLNKRYFRKFLDSKYYQDYRSEVLKVTPVESDIAFTDSNGMVDPASGAAWETDYGRRLKK